MRGATTDAIVAVIEALVFASPDPITPRMLNRLLNDEPKEDVKAALEALKADPPAKARIMPLSVAGAFQWNELRQTVERLFGDWEGAAPPLPSPASEGSASPSPSPTRGSRSTSIRTRRSRRSSTGTTAS